MTFKGYQPIRRPRYFAFALWAAALGRPPRIEEVEGFFGITRRNALQIHHEWMRAVMNQSATTSPAATGITMREPK